MKALLVIVGAWVFASIPVTFLIGRIMRRSDEDEAQSTHQSPQNHHEPPTIKAA